jgi:hypothetical protein
MKNEKAIAWFGLGAVAGALGVTVLSRLMDDKKAIEPEKNKEDAEKFGGIKKEERVKMRTEKMTKLAKSKTVYFLEFLHVDLQKKLFPM